MRCRSRVQLVLFALLALVAGWVATLSAPANWERGWQIVAAVVAAVAAGAAGTFLSEVIRAYRTVVESKKAPRETLKQSGVLPAPDQQSAAALLRPERAVVEFTGRTDELSRLLAWCTEPARCPVFLVTGQGGVGKTRLAMALADTLPDKKWCSQQVRPGTEVNALQSAAEMKKCVLLIVDYAETRPGLPAMLTEVAAQEAAGQAHGLRVLLLARQAGDWWNELDLESDATGELAARIPVWELPAALDAQHDNGRILQDALSFYAEARGCAAPSVGFSLDSTKQLPVLVLHAAALVAVLDSEESTSGGNAAANLGVLDRLLNHERRLWEKSARRVGITVPLPVLEQALAVVVLLHPETTDDTTVRVTMRRVPDLTDATEETIGALARWLRQLCTTAHGPADMLSPDLLAERHTANQLTNEQLRRNCFTDLTQPQATHALTMLTRACAHHEHAETLLDEILRHDLSELADAAIAAALQTGTLLGNLLANVLADVPVLEGTLRHIADAIPYPTVALGTTSVNVTQRLHSAVASQTNPEDRAYWSQRLAVVLAQEGRCDQALNASTEAVSLYRKLADSQPETFQADLAGALNNQSNRFADLGKLERALGASTEAVRIFKKLSEARPDAFQTDLASALNNQAACLGSLGQRKSALNANAEAVSLYGKLAEARPDAFQADLARTLSNQANYLADLGEHDWALKASTEAVRIFKKLSEARPDAFEANFASALSNQANHLADLGEHDWALKASAEAVSLYRKLADTRPETFQANLAGALNNQSNRLADLDQHDLELITEAVSLYRKLADTRPETFQADLANALNNQAACLASLNQYDIALKASAEAVSLYRKLADTRPETFQADLASALNNQAACLGILGERERGLKVISEAIVIWRDLVAQGFQVHQRDLGRSEVLRSRLSELR